jgi:CRP-like cAMP-binding protein
MLADFVAPSFLFWTFLLASVFLLVVLLRMAGDFLRQVAAGISLKLRRPFAPGDWIQLDELPAGRVVTMGWTVTTLATDSLAELQIPNRKLTRGVIRKIAEPVVLHCIKVTCPATVAPARVRTALRECLLDCDAVERQPEPVVLNANLGDQGIEYVARFRIKTFEPAEQVASTIRNRIWYAFRRAEIPFHVRGSDEHLRRDDTEIPTRRDRLRQVEIFAGLTEETLTELARAAKSVLFTTGETIVRQGEEGEVLFVLHAGEVSVTATAAGGSEREVNRLHPGQFFGELSLLTGERRSATVQAATECELIQLGRSEFGPILEQTPSLVASIQQILEARQADLKDRLDSPLAVSGGSRHDSLVARFRRNFQLPW